MPSFKLASGAQLGDELREVDVTPKGSGYFKILEQNKLADIPKPLEEEFQGPKVMKRKLSRLTESEAKVSPYEFNKASYWGDEDEMEEK